MLLHRFHQIEISSKELTSEVLEILANGNLDQLTRKIIQNTLEERHGCRYPRESILTCSFAHRKEEIKMAIENYLQVMEAVSKSKNQSKVCLVDVFKPRYLHQNQIQNPKIMLRKKWLMMVIRPIVYLRRLSEINLNCERKFGDLVFWLMNRWTSDCGGMSTKTTC